MKDPDLRHALKNRLTVMKCTLEVLLLKEVPPEVKTALQNINKEIDKMTEILSKNKI